MFLLLLVFGVIFTFRTPEGTITAPEESTAAAVRSEPTTTFSSPPPETKVPFAPPKVWPDDTPPLAVAPFDAATAKKHQQAWANHLGLPVEREIDLSGGVKLTLVLIPPGEFLMGSPEEERARFLEEARAADDKWTINNLPAERPQHRVKISRPFYLGRYEVTQAQWEAVMGSNPSKFTDKPSNPVEEVSWDDIQPFLEKLNEQPKEEAIQFVLPTEAQWEYVCRAGTTTVWHCGERDTTLQEYARLGGGGTRPVGELKPNAWTLYDMHGNVSEWCADWFAREYYAQSPPNDPSGPSASSACVHRGGSWGTRARYCRSAHRHPHSPVTRNWELGFRLAAVLVDE